MFLMKKIQLLCVSHNEVFCQDGSKFQWSPNWAGSYCGNINVLSRWLTQVGKGHILTIPKVKDYVRPWYNALETLNALNTHIHKHPDDLTSDTWLITSLKLLVCLNFLVFKSCFLWGSLLFVMWLTHQNEIMIHAGVFKQVEARPKTRDSFPGGLA